ncbi:BON domain-containing protein [Catenovulum adriaticum]|uniref:BON domain-containing protein n=1 Tax=Catenovulum adriaticum TaxID=2984846 RepID=A0ABY7ALG6_9ALTE|nr:BON domain-containing protein [Catenovulum sp. TS8]WAJ70097.1 BON domain-containing protein [Catenovulum sp. TS8]
MKYLKLIFACIIIQQLSGCAVALFAGAASTTAVVASDRRDVDTQLTDLSIEREINKWIEESPSLAKQTNIKVVSHNKNVLLIGQAPSGMLRDKVANLASTHGDLHDLYNEIRISKTTTPAQRTKDSWLTTKIKTRMLADKELDGQQVKIMTENGEVFLMGMLTAYEKKIAITIARNMDGVNRVIEIFEPYTKTNNDAQ